MNFGQLALDDDLAGFLEEVHDFCDTYVTEAVLDDEFRTGDSHDWRLHRALGERGWICPTWPIERGGAGLTPEHAEILERELERRLAPSITRSVTRNVASAVDRWMIEPLRSELLLAVARGESCFCLGYTEPDCGSDLAAVRTRAVRDGDEWVVNGQKMYTTGAQNSSHCFLLARTDPSQSRHRGLTMFLVPLDRPGIEIQAVHTLGGERTNMVFYDDVRIGDEYRLGPEGDGWAVLHGPLNEEHRVSEDRSLPLEESPGEPGMYVDAHVAALADAVTWARQPDERGRRPIDDPRVRATLARVDFELTLASMAPGPAGRVISADVLIRTGAALVDLVGPRGLVARGEAGALGGGWIEHVHRFAQGTAIYGGTTDIFRSMLAERYLGLPRSRAASS